MVNILKVTASGDAVLADHKVIKQIRLVAGSGAAATLIVFDGATQAGGTDIGKLAAVTGDHDKLCFEGGYTVENGLSLTLAGAGAVAYVHY